MQFRVLLFLASIFIFFGCKNAKEEIKAEVESNTQIVPEDSNPLYQDLEGNAIALSDYKGKKVFLNYWATWCAPCIEEMPDLLLLKDHLEKENFIFLLASDQSVKKIRDFKSDRGFDFQFIKFNGAYVEQKIHALPVTLVFNEVGEQVARFDGATSWNTPEIIEQLKNIQ